MFANLTSSRGTNETVSTPVPTTVISLPAGDQISAAATNATRATDPDARTTVPTTVISHPRRRWISRSGPGCHQGARFAIRELHRATDPDAIATIPTTVISLPAGDQICAAATNATRATDPDAIATVPTTVISLPAGAGSSSVKIMTRNYIQTTMAKSF